MIANITNKKNAALFQICFM